MQDAQRVRRNRKDNEVQDMENEDEARDARIAELDEQKWFGDHGNLVVLIQWMADNYYDRSEMARAVEKPWNYTAEYLQALEAMAEDA